MKPNRRQFLTMAGVVGLAGDRVFSGVARPDRRQGKSSPSGDSEIKAMRSRIRVAQIRIYPEKGKMASNHRRLMSVLRDIERAAKSLSE